MEPEKWLYVRFPRRIKDELEVKDIHKDIISVKMPRQKGRFCFIELENEEIAKKVKAELHKKDFDKGKLFVFRKRAGKEK